MFLWFFRKRATTRTAEGQPPRRLLSWRGRAVLNDALTPYVLDKTWDETMRLDFQHHLLKAAIHRLYFAPIDQPSSMLDVACGTGIWGREMAQQFPRARVMNFDFDRGPIERVMQSAGKGGHFPTNFRFQQADALKPFPYEDGEFDYVHARLITGFVPIPLWPQVVGEMARVTRRGGGYVELVDAEYGKSPSPLFAVLSKAVFTMLDKRQLSHGAGPYVADYMRRAGLVEVQSQRFEIGVESERIRKLLAANVYSIFKSMEPAIQKMQLMPEEEYHRALNGVQREMEEQGIVLPIIATWGRRP